MGYESYPLPSYHELRNWSYYIKLSLTTWLSTPQTRLPRPGPTITPSNSSPSFAHPLCIAHRWGGRPPFPLRLPVVSWCTPLWDGALRLPFPTLPMGNLTLRLWKHMWQWSCRNPHRHTLTTHCYIILIQMSCVSFTSEWSQYHPYSITVLFWFSARLCADIARKRSFAAPPILPHYSPP